MRIAVDAMGSERAPKVEVEGAIAACKEYNLDIVLVGDKEKIEKELSRYKPYPSRISIEHASEVVEMGESPSAAVRKKKDSSLSVGVKLVKDKSADAFVSAGNTGAVVTASSLFLRLLDKVDKPGIMITCPTLKQPTVLIDAGANINPTPKDLLLYGVMGNVYLSEIHNRKNAKVGLLNVGEEETKGTELLKTAHKLLEQANINFIGNIEGKDIFTGDVDVIVCDGFIGNVVLKVAESVGFTLAELLKQEFKSSVMTKIAALMLLPSLRHFKKRIDYAEYGGAPLLGIDGIAIIAHGRSSARAMKNAIRVAGEFVSHQINEHIIDAIKDLKMDTVQ